MTSTNPDGIDEVLKSFGLEVEQPAQQVQTSATTNLKVRVMFARSSGLSPVIVHLFVLGREVNEEGEGLEGELLQTRWTFQAESLRQFSEFYEFAAFRALGLDYHIDSGIKYHRNPPLPPTSDQNLVSYGLVAKLNDPQGAYLLRFVQRATYRLRTTYYKA